MGIKYRDVVIKKCSHDEDYAGRDVVLNYSSITDVVCLTQDDDTILLDIGQITEIYEMLQKV